MKGNIIKCNVFFSINAYLGRLNDYIAPFV
jgi:hypothetical protein